MLKYEDALRGAMHKAAPVLRFENNQWIAPTPAYTGKGIVVDPNDDSDFARTHIGRNGFIQAPHQVITSSIESLHALETTFRAIIKRPDPAEVNRRVRHERQHAEHMDSRFVYGISILSTPPDAPERIYSWRLFCAPDNWVTTRIAAALSLAAPERPSDGDMAGIRFLKYPHIRALAHSAMQHGLPVPLSYKHSPLAVGATRSNRPVPPASLAAYRTAA